MPFDQAPIAHVSATPLGGDLAVSWDSSAPAGSWYQVYLDRRLAWYGQATRATLPHPSSQVRIDVGVVPAAEAGVGLESTLPTPPGGGSRVEVKWLGGSYLGHASYRVYMGTTPGGAVDYSRSLKTIPAYALGIKSDGYGQGGYGLGSYGFASASYSWTSNPLLSGTWNVAVVPFDADGNAGTPLTWAIAVSGPPRPPTGLAYELKRGPGGGYGSGGYGDGGYGTDGGYGVGGYGDGGYGEGEGEGLPFVTLGWLASPGA